MLGFIGKWAGSKGMGKIPNIIGLNKGQARQALKDAGFNYGNEEEEAQSDESLTGKVKSQEIVSDTLLDYESVVNYKIHTFTFTPFGVFGFSPFGVFSFTPSFSVFSFTPTSCPDPSEWSQWSAWDIGPWGEWGECGEDGYKRQYRTYTRTRTRTAYTIVNGVCTAGTETDTETMQDENMEICGDVTPTFNFMPFSVFSFTPSFSVFSFTPSFSVFSFTPEAEAFSVFSFTPESTFSVFSFTPTSTFAVFSFAPWG